MARPPLIAAGPQFHTLLDLTGALVAELRCGKKKNWSLKIYPSRWRQKHGAQKDPWVTNQGAISNLGHYATNEVRTTVWIDLGNLRTDVQGVLEASAKERTII